MKYVIRWAPVALIILLAITQSATAGPDRFWGGKLQAEPATYQEGDDLAELVEYLEQEEVAYILRRNHPRSLTLYYVHEDDWRQTTEHWVCEKINAAFPKAQLKSLSIMDMGVSVRTDFDC